MLYYETVAIGRITGPVHLSVCLSGTGFKLENKQV